MIEMYYEYHNKIRTDKVCPFKVSRSINSYDGICNWHTNPEIIFILDGKGYVQYGSEVIPVQTSDIIVVNSESIHRVYSDTGISFCFMIIDDSFCRENGIDVSTSYFARIIRDESTLALCGVAADRVLEYRQSGAISDAIKAKAAMLELFADLYERHRDNRPHLASVKRSSEAYVKKVISYLSENYTQEVSLPELAKMCGITKYHLAREFKICTGHTVFQYLNEIRCRKAEYCLAKGMSVAETAYECGFESISYFSRTFKRIKGFSPSKSNSEN